MVTTKVHKIGQQASVQQRSEVSRSFACRAFHHVAEYRQVFSVVIAFIARQSEVFSVISAACPTADDMVHSKRTLRHEITELYVAPNAERNVVFEDLVPDHVAFPVIEKVDRRSRLAWLLWTGHDVHVPFNAQKVASHRAAGNLYITKRTPSRPEVFYLTNEGSG